MNFWKNATFFVTGLLGANLAYGSIAPAHADGQPKMQAALSALEAAQASLDAASEDKGGFRRKAIAATRDAIELTKKGIAFDNSHQSPDEKKKGEEKR